MNTFLRSLSLTVAIGAPLAACAGLVIPAAKLALCPARAAYQWQHRARIDDTAMLPARACYMRTPTGGYRCSRSIGCAADLDGGGS